MSNPAIVHPSEIASNAERASALSFEPKGLRTFTPTQAVISKSQGVFHWTPENRRLYDFTSGVLVANLGHNPEKWLKKLFKYMNWPTKGFPESSSNGKSDLAYLPALPLTAYNAFTPVESEASKRLVSLLRRSQGGGRLHQVMWAASGSEAIQKALWAAMGRDKTRQMIIATRHGFHGKKGLSGAVSGSENDTERDPRVQFIGFPMKEIHDLDMRNQPFDPQPYRQELDQLKARFGRKLGVLITEPYLGGGGSYHPPKVYLQMLQHFCRENDIVFILDEVQANFGRTSRMFAFEHYELEPDIVVLGKGLGNGVPVAAAAGRKDLFDALDYGDASDTWSANPLSSAAVLATLDIFETTNIFEKVAVVSDIIEQGLIQLKKFPFIGAIRGEERGMVWGVETKSHDGYSANEWANAFVLACYKGVGGDGIHLLGPLSKKVIRVSPPLTITPEEATTAMKLMTDSLKHLHELVSSINRNQPNQSLEFAQPVV